jgi:two-component system, sensor histidine kinase and response regulator
MEILQAKIIHLNEKFRSIDLSGYFTAVKNTISDFLELIKSIGDVGKMDEYERRKLRVFNLLNFFQLVTGILIPLIGLMQNHTLPVKIWLLACVPTIISMAVLVFNNYHKYQTAQLSYFILYPFFTGFVYLQGMSSGVELHFILYGVLAVFFLQDMGYMLFTVALTMVNYFVLSVLLKDFIYEVKKENRLLYFFNHLLALSFIFYGLYLIKKENSGYQIKILSKQKALRRQNEEIIKQQEIIGEKVALLEVQKSELAELNHLKTRVFSVISHDLKSPLYAMRNLFKNMHQTNLPAEQIKEMVPEIIMDLNYTIGLMENLLHWSKTQMQSNVVQPTEIDVSKIINDVMNLMRLQAEAKQIYIETKKAESILAYADKDMINVVLRNLLSNAIKFTPQQGYIEVGVNDFDDFIEVYVQDSGAGITREALKKINESNFYTTKGSAGESGTGLGLMLCKEFLAKNSGHMHIESEVGSGSIFSFTLPKAASLPV